MSFFHLRLKTHAIHYPPKDAKVCFACLRPRECQIRLGFSRQVSAVCSMQTDLNSLICVMVPDFGAAAYQKQD